MSIKGEKVDKIRAETINNLHKDKKKSYKNSNYQTLVFIKKV